MAGGRIPGAADPCGTLLHLPRFLLQAAGHGLELVADPLQPPAGPLMEVAASVGALVRPVPCLLDGRDDHLPAPPHRSGVSGAGSGFCSDVRANRLSVAGVEAQHRTRSFRFW